MPSPNGLGYYLPPRWGEDRRQPQVRRSSTMDFPLPPVGEGLFEVELTRWLVRPGDAVARGQGLAEVMSDKASMEVPSPFAGTVTELHATPGTKVKVGQKFLSYNPVADSAVVPAAARERRAEAPAAAVQSGRGSEGTASEPLASSREARAGIPA